MSEISTHNHIDVLQDKDSTNPPYAFVFDTPVPGTFDDVHAAVVQLLPTRYYDSLYHTIISHENRQKLYTEIADDCDIPLSPGTTIQRGQHGGVLLFHLSSDPKVLRTALIRNDLQKRPDGKLVLGRRCYGFGLATYTDPKIVETELRDRNYTVDNLIAIESHGMKDSHEVVVKQPFFSSMLAHAQQSIEADPMLNIALEQAADLFGSEEGQSSLNLSLQRYFAFTLSSLVIDFYCRIYPHNSRMAYRRMVQEGLSIPFGYQTFTHESFADVDSLHFDRNPLINTVKFMLAKERGIKYEGRKQVLDAIWILITEIAASPDSYCKDEFICFPPAGNSPPWISPGYTPIQKYVPNYSENDNLKKFVLQRLLIAKDDDLIKAHIMKHVTSESMHALLERCNGWFLLEETKKLFSKKERLATDIASNQVAVLAEFDPRIHRILPHEEITELFPQFAP